MKIEELHNHLFEILCTIDDICKKENVRWFLDSGTEIGAVRDGDFIPWDDDADTKVLAEDYPAFKAAMEKHLPPYMHLVEPWDFAPAFYDLVFHIYDDRYAIREPRGEDAWYHGWLRYVCVDVFIFTKAPASKWSQKWMIFRNKLLYGLAMNDRYRISWRKFTGPEKLQVACARAAGRALKINAEQICRRWWDSVNRYTHRDCSFRFAGNYKPRSLRFFPEDIYGSTAYVPIRGRLFPVPGGYDRELRLQYGDYMTPVQDSEKYGRHLPAEQGEPH